MLLFGFLVTYFAYGANLDKAVLTSRVTPVPPSGPIQSYNAVLDGYRLVFNVPDVPIGPAAASIVRGSSSDKVHGICYELTLQQYLLLCASEGVPFAYRATPVMVKRYDEEEGSTRDTIVGLDLSSIRRQRRIRAYAMGITNANVTERRPSLRYISILRKGARESNLEEEYCRFLDGIKHWEISSLFPNN